MKLFFNTRAKLERIDTGDKYYGWVAPSVKDKLFISFDQPVEIPMGTRFMIELSAKKGSTTMETTYAGVHDGKAVFNLPDLVRIDPPVEQARFRNEQVHANLLNGEQETAVVVLDIAPNGIGFLGTTSFDNNDVVTLDVSTPAGPVRIEGRVVYCRFEQDKQDQFRVGVEFTQLGRIDSARWNHLLAG